MRRSWETLCKLAGVQDLQIRDFRNKTSADYMLAGIPTELAMKGTGHTQHRTYEGYVKVDQQIARQIARQIAQDLEKHRRERQAKAKGERNG